MMAKFNPRQAATVILLRRAASNSFEVFLTRRPDNMPFLGGMYCYPGGRVNKEDYAPAMIERCVGMTPNQARKIIGAQFSPPEALGLWVAAVRELFEEVGVLLAVDDVGRNPSGVAPQAERLSVKRERLIAKSFDFLALLKSEGLRCDLRTLAPFSCWQTPARFSTRFDTRFFIAALPEGQVTLATSYEVAHSLWLTPERAMKLFVDNELPMIFPTFAALRTLADFQTFESVFEEFLPSL
jgi:8-oxo-dGTP pyrophosphatase MutT (NUDIX family)